MTHQITLTYIFSGDKDAALQEAATQLNAQTSPVSFEGVNTYLVFLSESGDTRYDEYSVIRSLMVAEEVEARKR